MGLASSSSSNLYRNNAGVAFPYSIAGLASIKTSSAGTGYYYFFYDWKIREAPCRSARVPVIAVLNTVPSTPNITESGGTLYANVTASSYQWYLNGNPIPGATSSSYTPSVDGIYTVTAKNGNCASGASSGYNFVMSSINDNLIMCEDCMTISPNPTNNHITLNIPFLKPANVTIQLTDALGRTVFREITYTNGIQNYVVNMQNLAQGTYLLTVQTNHQIIRRNIVKLQ